jgi:hypothetical protein
MGVGTLVDRAAGQTILDTFFNDIHSALDGDFVGRNSSGVATSGQNLGTTAFPWGTVRCSGINIDGSSLDVSQVSAPANSVISGKTRSTSNQPAFITPNGAAASFILAGATTNLVLSINGSAVTVTTDITKSSLTLAPSSNNTCLVDDALAVDQEDTRYWGEYGVNTDITVDNMGSAITALVGKYASFKINDGSNNEYFIAYVESSTKLSRIHRGFFYSSALAPFNRIKFANNDTITLMSTAWIFVENNATTVDVSYNMPVWDFSSPSSPVTGDYWFDLGSSTWKRYDGASFQIINRTFVGIALIDTANCVAARCVDFDARYKRDMTFELDVFSTSVVRASRTQMTANVAGQLINFGYSLPTWNMTTDLAASTDMYNATEQASTRYFFFIKDTGDTVISDIRPYWREEYQSWYHPHNPWRCVGSGYNDGSSNISAAGGWSDGIEQTHIQLRTFNAFGATATRVPRFTTTTRNTGGDVDFLDDATDATRFIIRRPGVYAISFSLGGSSGGGQNIGVTVNGDATATVQDSANAAFRTAFARINTDSAVEDAVSVAWTGHLKYGDIVRAHGSASSPTTAAYGHVTVKRVCN